MTLGRLLGRLIPESPARTAGEQLRLVHEARKFIDQLPEQQQATSSTDPHDQPNQ